jgi:hypothetical protein
VLADRSEGKRKEITGVITLDEAKEALKRLTALGVPGDSDIKFYLHTGWTGRARVPGEDPDPQGRITSLALWGEGDEE